MSRNTNKLAKLCFGTLAALLLISSGDVAAGPMDIAVVVNAKNNVTKLSKAELSRIFRTTKTAWDGGGDIVAVNLPESNELRQAFDEAVLGLDTKNVAKYWIDRKIRGGTRPPRRAPSTSAVLKLVTDEVGAIGYVRADEVERNGLRTVAIVRGGDVL